MAKKTGILVLLGLGLAAIIGVTWWNKKKSLGQLSAQLSNVDVDNGNTTLLNLALNSTITVINPTSQSYQFYSLSGKLFYSGKQVATFNYVQANLQNTTISPFSQKDFIVKINIPVLAEISALLNIVREYLRTHKINIFLSMDASINISGIVIPLEQDFNISI